MSERQPQHQAPSSFVRYVYNPAVVQVTKALEIAIATNANPEVIEGLKTALLYSDMREDYCLECTSPESAHCRKISENTRIHPWEQVKEQGKISYILPPRMLSGHLEGQFLKSLVSIHRARRVLEVGMYTGYSALCMAEALPAGGELVTIDREPYLQQLNRLAFDASPHGSKITIRIGAALQVLQELTKEGQKFDLIFLDADKSEYKDYLKLAFEGGLLAENGSIACDNAFRGGHSYLPSDGPPDVSRIFGELVANDKSLHKVLLPIRDGVLLIRRLSDVEQDGPSD